MFYELFVLFSRTENKFCELKYDKIQSDNVFASIYVSVAREYVMSMDVALAPAANTRIGFDDDAVMCLCVFDSDIVIILCPLNFCK